MLGRDEIERRFTYHAPNEDQVRKYGSIRNMALAFAVMIDEEVPDSREKSLALTKLEEAVMHANSAIARRSE